MKLSNGLKDALLAQLLTNFKFPMGSASYASAYGGYRIRFFDSSQMSVQYPLNSQVEFNSTYFQSNAPVGMLLDFGVSIAIPYNAFVSAGRSIKLLGTYTENAKITGTADLACIFACSDSGGGTKGAFSTITNIGRILITDSVVPNGQQGAFVLTQTVMNAGDSISIADFTLNLIEP